MITNRKLAIKLWQTNSERNLALGEINFSILLSAITFSFALSSTSLMANPLPTYIGCKSNASPALVNLEMNVRNSVDESGEYVCPLLNNRKLRELVNEFGVGSIFAYPLAPNTCLTGAVQNGTIQIGDNTIQVDPSSSYSATAQRLFAVPDNQAPPGLGGHGIVASSEDFTLQKLAALTVLHLQGDDSFGKKYKFDIVASDSTLATETGEDTEEFLIIGSKGKYKVTGFLTGRGQLFSQIPLDLTLNVFGTICIQAPPPHSNNVGRNSPRRVFR